MTHAVSLAWPDGRTEELSIPSREIILGAAEDASLGLPFGCLTGACGTCTGRLREGEVEHRRPPRALKDRHLAAGYVLLCVTEPRSDCRLAVGARIQAELVEDPWR